MPVKCFFLLSIILRLRPHNQSSTNHSFIPDEGHPLLHSVHTFWDLSEVILADSLLGHAESAVGAASHTQVSTAAWSNVTGKELGRTFISTSRKITEVKYPAYSLSFVGILLLTFLPLNIERKFPPWMEN